MMRNAFRTLSLLYIAAACGGGPGPVTTAPSPHPAGTTPQAADTAAIAKAQRDSARLPYTEADIRFMSGMISHHAQAILMAGWALENSTNPSVRTLAGRIINAQQDEIALMQGWLRDRRQPVPEASPHGMRMTMNGMEHHMRMPGMLDEAELKRLQAARGADFDVLFVRSMIRHHEGAVRMVRELFGTPGAGQDDVVFKFASDVHVDQATEIERMRRMLVALTFENPSP